MAVQGIDGKGNIYQQAQETDTHWLASGGKGSFNYRLVFNLELPLRQPRLRIQAWDRDIVGRSDSIGEHIFSLRSMFSQLLAQVKEGNGTTAEIRHPASKTPLNLGREWFSVSHPSKKPQFHEMVQFTTTLPGMSNMVVSVYDWDKYTSDDLVGKTIIDLEQRWFSEEWQKLTTPTTDSEGNRTAAMMPLERRVLTPSGDSEEQSQGALDMWLEMFHEVEERDNPVMDITPAPPVMVEMRCVVYEARNMTAKDVATLQNDLYIRVIVQ
eukprot:gene23629-28623_t